MQIVREAAPDQCLRCDAEYPRRGLTHDGEGLEEQGMRVIYSWALAPQALGWWQALNPLS